MSGPRRTDPPGGGNRLGEHPNVAGRERELRDLAAAVRRLIEATNTNAATREETAALARAVSGVADALERSVPERVPPRYAGLVPSGDRGDPHRYFPYDPVMGLYNPLALPIELEWRPPRALGRARFTTPYEGPPGCVHGAVLASAFDQVLNVANLMSGTAGPTRELTLRYLRPTPLDRELLFEAQVERTEGRRIETRGELRCGETLTVEARGVFVQVDAERIRRMRELPDERGGGDAK